MDLGGEEENGSCNQFSVVWCHEKNLAGYFFDIVTPPAAAEVGREVDRYEVRKKE